MTGAGIIREAMKFAGIQVIELPDIEKDIPCDSMHSGDHGISWVSCGKPAKYRVRVTCEVGHVRHVFMCDPCLVTVKTDLDSWICRVCDAPLKGWTET